MRSCLDAKKIFTEIESEKTDKLDFSDLLFKDEKAKLRNVATFRGHSAYVRALTVLPDGRLASSSSSSTDYTIKLWDLKSGACTATLDGHKDRVYALTVLPDGRLASGSWDKTIKLWDLTSGTCATTLSGHSSSVVALTVLPDGRLASGSWDKTIKLWDLTSGTCATTLSGHSHWVNALTVLPDGRLTSGSSDKTIKLWDVGLRLIAFADLKIFLSALQKNQSIKSLNLQKTLLTDKDIPELIELLKPNTALIELDIRNTDSLRYHQIIILE